jgi:DNA invertase Pin-like site-specific DNA recombinase
MPVACPRAARWKAGSKSLTDAIDKGTRSGRFFFHVMASLAEMERDPTVERTRAGLEIARQLGRKVGVAAAATKLRSSAR